MPFLLQVTIAATNTAQPLVSPAQGGIANAINYQFVLFQNNGSNTMRLGDASVSNTKGIIIQQTGSLESSLALTYTGTINSWYVAGTQGDVLDILYEP